MKNITLISNFIVFFEKAAGIEDIQLLASFFIPGFLPLYGSHLFCKRDQLASIPTLICSAWLLLENFKKPYGL